MKSTILARGRVLDSVTKFPLNNVIVGLKLKTLPDSLLFSNGRLAIDSQLIGKAILALARTGPDGAFNFNVQLSNDTELFAYRKGFHLWRSTERPPSSEDNIAEYLIHLDDERELNIQTKSRFRFTCVLNQVTPNPFSLEVGDSIKGEFSFTMISILPGYYPQDSSSGGVSLNLGEYHYAANPESLPHYTIYTVNNDSSVLPTRDMFNIESGDPRLATELGLNNVQLLFSFLDLTGTLFDFETLPMQLKIQWFESTNVNFTGFLIYPDLWDEAWHMQGSITSIERMP